MTDLPRCCLTTPDPGAWKAGVDDGADSPMINAMHNIRDRLSYNMPLGDFIWALESSIGIDNRTMLGGDIQRCLLSNAAYRLKILAQGVDPRPWRSWADRIKDAWAVLRGRGVCIRTSS